MREVYSRISEAQKRDRRKAVSLAGVQGFEPQLTDPESAVLPLDDTPIFGRQTDSKSTSSITPVQYLGGVPKRGYR